MPSVVKLLLSIGQSVCCCPSSSISHITIRHDLYLCGTMNQLLSCLLQYRSCSKRTYRLRIQIVFKFYVSV